MAEINLVLKLKNLASKGLDNVSGAFKGVADTVKQAGDNAKKAQNPFTKFANFLKARFVITLGDIIRLGQRVIRFFVDASKKAQEQERVVNSLNQALKNQGIFTRATTKALQDQASALQKVTTFGDEAIIALQTMLINFGVMPKDIDRVTRATLDMAVATGMDLNTAGNLLARSLGSSTNALARYGIEITGAVGSTERLDTAIKNISDKFGGQATAKTEIMLGSIKQLNNIWSDLQETIMTTNNNAITPYIKGLTNILEKTNELIKGKSPLEKDIERANKIRKSIGWATKSYDDYGTTLGVIGGLEAELSASSDKRLTRKERAQRAELQRQLEILSTLESGIILQKKQKEEEARLEQERIDKQQAEIKRLQELEEAKQKQIQITEAMAKASRDAAVAMANADKEAKQQQIKNAQEFSDLMGTITEDGGKTIGEAIKKQLSAQIDAWMATEIAKAQASAPLTFGASLAAIAPIIGAGTAGKVAINAVKFADGGVIKATQGGQTGNINGVNSTVAENRSDEAIIPLEDDARVKELMGGGQTVVNLIIDGQKLAQAVVNGYNKGRNLNTVTKIKER